MVPVNGFDSKMMPDEPEDDLSVSDPLPIGSENKTADGINQREVGFGKTPTDKAAVMDSYGGASRGSSPIPADMLAVSYNKSEDELVKGVGKKTKKKIITSRVAKRKVSTSVNMLEFIRCLQRITVDVNTAQCDIDSYTVSPYIEALTSFGNDVKSNLDAVLLKQKRNKPSSDSTATTHVLSESSEVSNEENVKKLPLKIRRALYLNVLNEMFINLERAKVHISFSREHLKYFLVTHQRFVSVNDFINTNCLKVKSKKGGLAKKQKSTARLSNGAILVEYCRSPYLFASNLSRCEATDVEAIRFIVEHDITVSSAIYRNVSWKMKDLKYISDKSDVEREDYVRIPIQNFKRAALLISECVILLYDGVQFGLPTPGIERDITAAMIASANLKRKEYIVLDVLLASKLQVIDIITTNKESLVLPDDYAKRLQQIKELILDVKTVSIDESRNDCSYIQKSKLLHDAPVYIRYKPNPTLAAVGLQYNTVLLAYKDEKGDHLVYRLKTVNSGPSSLPLGIIPLQISTASNECEIIVDMNMLNNNSLPNHSVSLSNHETNYQRVKILGLENESDVRLFTRALSVELKEGNKLGSLSGNPITSVRNCRPLSTQKDASGAEVLSMQNLTSYINNPNNFGDLIKAISKSSQFDNIIRCLQADNADFDAINLGY